jgi:hypothetical protein
LGFQVCEGGGERRAGEIRQRKLVVRTAARMIPSPPPRLPGTNV